MAVEEHREEFEGVLHVSFHEAYKVWGVLDVSENMPWEGWLTPHEEGDLPRIAQAGIIAQCPEKTHDFMEPDDPTYWEKTVCLFVEGRNMVGNICFLGELGSKGRINFRAVLHEGTEEYCEEMFKNL